MPHLSPETKTFIAELDAACEAHLDWTRRVLRFIVLRATPCEDVVSPLAHTLCHFGCWFNLNRVYFEALDSDTTQRIEAAHQTMHDAIRAICSSVLAGQPGQDAHLKAFEQTQSELVRLIARFKTLILSNAVRHDPLTGLALRYEIENDFATYQKDALRNHRLMFVVMIDADHFKRINDNYGHPAGDKVLCHLANALKNNIRSNEPLYRFGGEEFLWFMQCNSLAEAEQSADRLLASIRSTPILIGEEITVSLTITLGLAQLGDGEEIASAIKRADAALYEGKNTGRDRYVVASP